MACITVLFLTSVRSCSKKIIYYEKCMGFVVFRFFLRRFGQCLHFSQKFLFFSKNTVPIFKKMVQLEKPVALLCAGIFR